MWKRRIFDNGNPVCGNCIHFIKKSNSQYYCKIHIERHKSGIMKYNRTRHDASCADYVFFYTATNH
ncbi:MAG: hypothetical protein HUK08_00310 [Bacteroidaceae bacterium]|nr:hypothetical protein [Bacteroidaceae bacterium]